MSDSIHQWSMPIDPSATSSKSIQEGQKTAKRKSTFDESAGSAETDYFVQEIARDLILKESLFPVEKRSSDEIPPIPIITPITPTAPLEKIRSASSGLFRPSSSRSLEGRSSVRPPSALSIVKYMNELHIEADNRNSFSREFPSAPQSARSTPGPASARNPQRRFSDQFFEQHINSPLPTFHQEDQNTEEDIPEFSEDDFADVLQYCDGNIHSRALKDYFSSVRAPNEVYKLTLDGLFSSLQRDAIEQSFSFFIQVFPSISCLSLCDVNLPGSFLDMITQFKELRHLDCSDSLRMILDNPTSLTRFENLKNLILRNNLSSSRLDDSTFMIICQLITLQELNIENAPISDLAFRKILDLRYLEELTISGCDQLSVDSLPVICQLHSLRALDISKTRFSSEDLLFLAKNAPHLEDICIDADKFSMDVLKDFISLRLNVAKERNDSTFPMVKFHDHTGKLIEISQPTKRVAQVAKVSYSGSNPLF